MRRDHLTYDAERRIRSPTRRRPISQDRTLTNIGVKADVAITSGIHNVKVGGDHHRHQAARAVHASASPIRPMRRISGGRERQLRPDRLAPFDLTHGGTPLAYDQAATIKQQAAYVQDDIKAGNATFKLGVRLDHYDGLTPQTLVQPRLGVSYAVPAAARCCARRTAGRMETPYNENLLLSSGVGLNGLFGDGAAAAAGQAQSGRSRHPAGLRPMVGRRFRLLQQAHDQRLRLRRAVRHADRVPGRVGSLDG